MVIDFHAPFLVNFISKSTELIAFFSNFASNQEIQQLFRCIIKKFLLVKSLIFQCHKFDKSFNKFNLSEDSDIEMSFLCKQNFTEFKFDQFNDRRKIFGFFSYVCDDLHKRIVINL